MTKDEALDLALEALESCGAGHITDGGNQWHDEKLVDKAITAIKQARALDKKAENARELGLDYEPVAWVEYETGNHTKRPQNCGTSYCSCVECVMEPAVQEPVAWIEHEWSGSGLRHLHFERREQSVRDEVMNPIWTPLYTTPPAQPAPAPGYCKHCKQYSIEEPLPAALEQDVFWGVDWGKAGDKSCVSIIKRLPNGKIEVVAVEYEP
jgi:hypothetical protein